MNITTQAPLMTQSHSVLWFAPYLDPLYCADLETLLQAEGRDKHKVYKVRGRGAERRGYSLSQKPHNAHQEKCSCQSYSQD